MGQEYNTKNNYFVEKYISKVVLGGFCCVALYASYLMWPALIKQGISFIRGNFSCIEKIIQKP